MNHPSPAGANGEPGFSSSSSAHLAAPVTRRRRGRSLSLRLVLAAVACAVTSLIVTCLFIARAGGRMAEDAALERATLDAERLAANVGDDLRATLGVARGMAAQLAAARGAGRQPTREQLDTQLRGLLDSRPDWFGVYSVWEPDAFDGRDAAFAGKYAGTDATGRVLSYWNRGGGGIALEAVSEYETGHNDWYAQPRRTLRDALIDPTVYSAGGQIQCGKKLAHTRSPGFQPVTPAPTSTTSPAPSEQGMTGSGLRAK